MIRWTTDELLALHRGAMEAYVEALAEKRLMKADFIFKEAKVFKRLLKPRLKRLEDKQDHVR